MWLVGASDSKYHIGDSRDCGTLANKMPNGIINGMKLKVDKAGRVILPKPLRDRMGLQEGSELDAVDPLRGSS